MRVILSGCSGKMGRAVAAALAESGDTVAAGIDVAPGGEEFPVYKDFGDIPGDAAGDVIVDFSSPAALPGLLRYATAGGVPAVLATTGYSEEDIAAIRRAAERIPVFFSFNMSLGINLLRTLAGIAAKALPGFDIEIIERHHNQKKDAPSGTALMLADAVNDGRKRYIYDRTLRRAPRDPEEIGIHSVRGGTIVGEHEVIFAGKDEVVTLSHSAASKAVFATGAVSAARFVVGKAPGLYSMEDLLRE